MHQRHKQHDTSGLVETKKLKKKTATNLPHNQAICIAMTCFVVGLLSVLVPLMFAWIIPEIWDQICPTTKCEICPAPLPPSYSPLPPPSYTATPSKSIPTVILGECQTNAECHDKYAPSQPNYAVCLKLGEELRCVNRTCDDSNLQTIDEYDPVLQQCKYTPRCASLHPSLGAHFTSELGCVGYLRVSILALNTEIGQSVLQLFEREYEDWNATITNPEIALLKLRFELIQDASDLEITPELVMVWEIEKSFENRAPRCSFSSSPHENLQTGCIAASVSTNTNENYAEYSFSSGNHRQDEKIWKLLYSNKARQLNNEWHGHGRALERIKTQLSDNLETALNSLQ